MVTVTDRDILHAMVYGAEASATFGKVAPSAGFEIGLKNKEFAVNAAATYTADLFTAKAGATFISAFDFSAKQLYGNASIESTALVPGATLTLAYAPVKSDSGAYTTNYFDKFGGTVSAKCSIAF